MRKYEAKPMTNKEKNVYRIAIGLLLGIIILTAIKLFIPKATIDYMMWNEYKYLIESVSYPKWQILLYVFISALSLPFLLPWTIFRKRHGSEYRGTALLRKGIYHSDSVAEIRLMRKRTIIVADERCYRIINMIIVFGEYEEYKDGEKIILEGAKGEVHENLMLKRQLAMKEEEIMEKDRIIESLRSLFSEIKVNREMKRHENIREEKEE